MSDDYLLDAARKHWDMILGVYKAQEEQRPILLFDIQEQRIYLYEYEGFKEEMNPRNQALLQDQYERAIAMNQIVVFVRDNVERRLSRSNNSPSVDYDASSYPTSLSV
jgi:hypothetical protein